MSLPCSVIDLIPQAGNMSFDQTLITAELNDGKSITVINKDNIFLDDGYNLSNIVLIEYINQLNAAIRGYNGKYHSQPSQKGLFVGLQEVQFFQTVCLGDCLTLSATMLERIAQITFVQGFIFRDGERIAELVTKLYEVRDSSEFELLTRPGQTGQQYIGLKPHNKLNTPVYLTSNLHRELYSFLHDMSINDGDISFNITCPGGFQVFKGHFPGNPILPGIVLLEIAILAVELLHKKPVKCKCVNKMKISGIVHPNQAIKCNLTINNVQGSTLTFSAIFMNGNDKEVSRISGSCSE